MLYTKSCAFKAIEGPLKILKLKVIIDNKMEPSNTLSKIYRQSTLDDLHYITKKIFNEGYLAESKLLELSEKLAKHYKFADVIAWFKRYREDMAQVSFANQISLQEKNRPNIEYENTKLIKEFKEDMMLSDISKELINAKISYIEKQNTNLSSYLEKIQTIIQQMIDRDCDSWLIELYKEIQKYEKIAGKYRSNKIMIAHFTGEFNNNKTVITEEMIQLAKKVPFNKLLKLENIGTRERCKCPFHNEKTASFYVYPDTNRGYCHGCGRSVDTIQYLVEIKKLKFNEAILMLLSY